MTDTDPDTAAAGTGHDLEYAQDQDDHRPDRHQPATDGQCAGVAWG